MSERGHHPPFVAQLLVPIRGVIEAFGDHDAVHAGVEITGLVSLVLGNQVGELIWLGRGRHERLGASEWVRV